MKETAKPEFKSFKIFKKNLVAVNLQKRTVIQDKSPVTGFSILDLSKYYMYDFFYNVYSKSFPNSNILMSDTDSYCFSVHGMTLKSYQQKLSAIEDHFDFSTLPKDNSLYNTKNQG